MKVRRILIGSAVAALLALGGSFGWRWYTTPVPPVVPLDGLTEETTEAVGKALRRLRTEPRSGEAWGELALVLIGNGFPDQALLCLVQARRFDPSQPRWAYWQGATLLPSQPTKGIAHFREALGLAPDREQRAAILFALILALVEEGQLDEAESYSNDLREIEPDGPRGHFGRGLLAIARNDPTGAREHLRLLTDNPFARRAACALLTTLAIDKEQAEGYRKRAADLPSDAVWPNPFQDELAPYQANLSPPLATFRDLEARGRSGEAMTFLRNVAARSPDEAVCFTLGVALLSRNDLVGAEEAFRQAIRFNPRNTKAHLFLATALLQEGENQERPPEALFQQALAAADEALRLQGDLAFAHSIRGRALKHLGRQEESLAALREAALRGPEFAEMHQALGEALAESGRVREGLEHLEAAVRYAKPAEVAAARRALEKWTEKAKTKP